MINNAAEKGREIVAIVVSDRRNKTITVETEHIKKHRLYDKNFKINKKIKARCEDLDLMIGDTVIIQETKPISKDVHFKVISKVK